MSVPIERKLKNCFFLSGIDTLLDEDKHKCWRYIFYFAISEYKKEGNNIMASGEGFNGLRGQT